MLNVLFALATGLIQVFLVAYQGRQIAAYQTRGGTIWFIFLVGLLISTVWVFNVRAANQHWPSQLAYILGAGCGTAFAMKVRMK